MRYKTEFVKGMKKAQVEEANIRMRIRLGQWKEERP